MPPALPALDPEERRSEALLDLVPAEPDRSYDVRAVVGELLDAGEYFEVYPAWAPDLLRAFAQPAGNVVGIVSHQPAASAGVLDVRAGDKAARFVAACDALTGGRASSSTEPQA